MRELCVCHDEPEVLDGVAAPTAARPRSAVPPARVSIAQLVAERIKSKAFFWSVELIPGTTPQLQSSLEQSLHLLTCHPPAFASVTWHVEHLNIAPSEGGTVLEHPALELCKLLQDTYGIPALMHLAAGKMNRTDTQAVLQACLAAGVTNVLALRGDDKIEAESDFPHALHLVTFIREVFGSKFKIGVAGYPSGHPETKSLVENLHHLKEKVDAGADFVLTQMINSLEEFKTFTETCNKLGMTVPIIPGLFLIQSYSAFDKFIRTCKIKVPLKFLEDLKELQNKQHQSEYGEHHFRNLIKQLVIHSCCPGIHIFTMNRVAVVLKPLSEIILI